MLRFALFALLMTTALAPASASVWSRLDVLEKRVDNLARTSQRVDTLQAENSRLNGEIEELRHQLEQLQEQQREMYLDIERRLGGTADNASVEEPAADADSVAATPPQEQPADTGVQQQQAEVAQDADSSQDEQQQYRHAYDLLMSKRDFQRSIAAFEALLQAYPQGVYADNAQFWLAEAHYAQNELDAALQEFQQLVDNYAQSPKVPDAVYKVGYIHKVRGDSDKAREVFQGLIEHYPGTPAAKLAALRLESLR